jgi:hypothetical protein
VGKWPAAAEQEAAYGRSRSASRFRSGYLIA